MCMCVGGMVCVGGGNMRAYKPLFTCTRVSMATNKYDSLKIIKWSIFNNNNKKEYIMYFFKASVQLLQFVCTQNPKWDHQVI